MRAGILEIVGLFLVIIGVAGVVGAASMVSTPLAVALASAFVVLGGVIALFVAVTLDKAAKAEQAKAPRTATP